MWVELQGHFHQRPHIAALGVSDARHVQSVVVREIKRENYDQVRRRKKGKR